MQMTEYLSQGRRLNDMIAFETARIRELRACADQIGAVRADGERVQQSASGDAPYARALQRIWEMQENIDRQLAQLIALDRQIGEVIGTLLSGDYRMLLRYRAQRRKYLRRKRELAARRAARERSVDPPLSVESTRRLADFVDEELQKREHKE